MTNRNDSGKKKPLHTLTKKEFDDLKNLGMLWEFYPDAPEHWQWSGKDFLFDHISQCDGDYTV